MDIFFGAVGGVVLDQLGAKPRDLHSDAGVGPGVEVCLSPEDGSGNLILFGRIFRICIRLFDKIAE